MMFKPDKDLILLCHCSLLDVDWVNRFGAKSLKAKHSKRIKNEAALIRDKIVEEKGECEICGMSYKPILQIHHILPVSKFGNNDPDNIICVCPNCHKTLHHLYHSLKKTEEELLLAYCHIPKEIKTKIWGVTEIYAKKCDETCRYINSYDDSDYDESMYDGGKA